MGAPADASVATFAARAAALGARVPPGWLAALLGRSAWATGPGRINPLDGRTLAPQGWAVLAFHGLLDACGGRARSARGRALVFDLAAAVVPVAVLGPVARRRVPADVQHSAWVRQELRRMRLADAAAACLLALEACGALIETPAMLEQAHWRLGPGAGASDADAVSAAVADVVWHCREDARVLLAAIAARSA